MLKPTHRLAIFGLATVSLQGCLTETTKDLLLQSTSQFTAPLGPVHVPPRDSGFSLQGSLSVSDGQARSMSTTLSQQQPFLGSDQGSTAEVDGPTDLSFAAVQASGNASLFLTDHLRLSIGLESSSLGTAKWGELGFRFGREISVEAYSALGDVPVRTLSAWRLWTQDVDLETQRRDTASTLQQSDIRQSNAFFRMGTTVARREGGPWGECEITALGLFDSPRAGTSWTTSLFTLGTGWTQRTDFGAWTAYLRATTTWKDWLPQVGIQWTGEIGR